MVEFMSKSSHEISLEIDEQEKELLRQLDNVHVLEQEKLAKQRQKLTLQGEIKDLEIIVDKGHYLVTETKLKLSQLRRDYWTAKDMNL